MTDPATPLDRAHAAMDAAPDDDALRLRFYDRLAEAELYLLLDKPPEDDRIDPTVFDAGEARYALAFDLEDRLADFVEGSVPYAALSGRRLAAMLAETGLGLALNPDVAPSAMLLDADAMRWLADTLADGPARTEAQARELTAPAGLPDALLTALDGKLATMAGRAAGAYLAGVTWDTGARGHLLAFVDAAPGAEDALARAVHEALAFSGLEAGSLDVMFLRAADGVAARLGRVGLRFDLPAPAAPEQTVRPAPGSDPDRPPRLR
ncbi:SseB family protein [Meridianimarinicoccus sp. RP-17]|uniref:SseB family protein n=1 Tax=Meridianimarinicoccus zhengii TaxID=2056810 RepID=UPI000DAEF87C|nr:SseB family protein [Phycocomes zhengii]